MLCHDGAVAQFLDDLDLGLQILAGEFYEGGFVEAGGEVVLVGRFESGVVRVEPFDGEFEGAAGVEAGGARVRVNGLLSLGGGDVDFGPFGFEEAEVRHGQRSPWKARCWREVKRASSFSRDPSYCFRCISIPEYLFENSICSCIGGDGIIKCFRSFK